MSLPEFFEPLLAQQYSEADIERIKEGYRAQRNVTLRANALSSSKDEVASELDSAGIAWSGVDWYNDAFVIETARERQIWDLPIYEQGKVYLQSLSSMLPPIVLEAHANEDVLDMCAAPGGKTSQIAALTGNRAHLTACEMHAPRADKLEHNLAKLGARNVVVMRTDARRMDEFFRFDRILVDAPCSGSGTLKLDNPNGLARFTPKLIEKSKKSQRALLSKALTLMKPGSTLVYSTCSILEEENESVVRDCLSKVRRQGTFELKPLTFA
ncbi:MAG: RsmB/NOP family class I SAM-dependent RNA methyltransferase, partial [Eggerthellaceae bacterium]|nr:RsmB/NOP family class I SAM-dependent RNA methyltransferase [Eggerthellaceae bacterium]